MSKDTENYVENNTDTSAQEANAFLRERFLYFISTITVDGGKTCTIDMLENTTVTCDLKAFDSHFQNVFVKNLRTPLPPVLDNAVLRTDDILTITCDIANK